MTAERRHRRHPTQLKLRLVESYLNGEGSMKSIAKAHDITHTLLMIWVDKYGRGELTDEIDHVERARETEAKIAALERKVGQLTMELDVLKKSASSDGRERRAGVDHLRACGICVSEGCRVMSLPCSTYYKAPDAQQEQFQQQPDDGFAERSRTSWTTGRPTVIDASRTSCAAAASWQTTNAWLVSCGRGACKPALHVASSQRPTASMTIQSSRTLLETSCRRGRTSWGWRTSPTCSCRVASPIETDLISSAWLDVATSEPYDNAKAESFMKTLKHEEVLKINYRDQQRLPRFLKEIYNRRGLHSSLGYHSTGWGKFGCP